MTIYNMPRHDRSTKLHHKKRHKKPHSYKLAASVGDVHMVWGCFKVGVRDRDRDANIGRDTDNMLTGGGKQLGEGSRGNRR